MNPQATLDQLNALRLGGMARQYEAVLKLPANQHPDAHTLIATLADAEHLHRNHAKIQLYLRLGKLRYPATLEQLNYDPSRNLSKDHIIPLMDCSWVERAENILITGPTGSGKSFLACAFGHQACLMGYRVLYFNMNRFIDKILCTKLDGSFPKFLNHLERMHLIILDDFGIAPWTKISDWLCSKCSKTDMVKKPFSSLRKSLSPIGTTISPIQPWPTLS